MFIPNKVARQGGYSWPIHPDQLEGHGIKAITFIHTPTIHTHAASARGPWQWVKSPGEWRQLRFRLLQERLRKEEEGEIPTPACRVTLPGLVCWQRVSQEVRGRRIS